MLIAKVNAFHSGSWAANQAVAGFVHRGSILYPHLAADTRPESLAPAPAPHGGIASRSTGRRLSGSAFGSDRRTGATAAVGGLPVDGNEGHLGRDSREFAEGRESEPLPLPTDSAECIRRPGGRAGARSDAEASPREATVARGRAAAQPGRPTGG